MEHPIESYWAKRLEAVKGALEHNRFGVHVVADAQAARDLVLNELLPRLAPRSVAWAGSMTFMATGLYETLRLRTDLEVLDTFDKSLTPQDLLERRRQALLADLFLTGANAVTESGLLVNLDMIGNRVAAMHFGPRTVIILAGRNKVVADLEDAMFRIKNFVAPANAMRLDKAVPCAKTSYCEDCHAPERICNIWTITEKSFPEGRIQVVLINETLGL